MTTALCPGILTGIAAWALGSLYCRTEELALCTGLLHASVSGLSCPLAGKPPFNGANHVALLRAIERQEAQVPEPIRRALSAACASLLHGLLRRNPVERLTFEEFFAHPFLRSGSRSSSSQSGSRHSSQSSSLTYSAEPSPMKPADRCGSSQRSCPINNSKEAVPPLRYSAEPSPMKPANRWLIPVVLFPLPP